MSKPDAQPQEDPRNKADQPPFPHQPQDPPGLERDLKPRADHGEASYRGYQRLEGRVAIVTGGDSGIGKAVALAYAREGADLVLSYLEEEAEDARDTERLVREAGRKAVLVPGDLGEEGYCRDLVARTLKEFGRVDILVNNAAHQRSYDNLQDIPSEAFERTFRVNLFSMFWLAKAAARHMPPGSSIINTTSIQAFLPTPGLLPYASTKGAIVTFTKALAGLLAEQGIRVNAVAPGPIWTPLIPSTLPQEKVQSFGGDTPLGRPGQPGELAPLYVLLASEEGSYISAAVVEVTGGRPLT
jgi:NAD(P)-dependent dehydrogenase (short-subunit alcohol dehydrogenase family)